ncbi:MAG TPA: hypothetical protein VNP04_30650 [Alphaproteobacteria bacterium]|nr:hypothetical protein [Alphaproteobacteria bacterium]
MYPPPKRRWPGLLGAYLVLLILLALPAVPIYYFVEPAYKLLVLRVCMAVVLAFTFYRMVQEVRVQLEGQPRTDFEAAAQPPVPMLSMAPQFAKLRDEVTNSVRSQSYFDHILRRRLLTLLERHLRRRLGIGVADLGEPPLDHKGRYDSSLSLWERVRVRENDGVRQAPSPQPSPEGRGRRRPGAHHAPRTIPTPVRPSLEGLNPELLDLIMRERPRRLLPRRGMSLRQLRAVVQMLEDLR